MSEETSKSYWVKITESICVTIFLCFVSVILFKSCEAKYSYDLETEKVKRVQKP